ncbi:hypothetical protein KSP40_PGU006426 [Platanthera guangdongensis]|uniref:Uncharacterized protein n=1 Tax=Platanthera guangdongensis TaxID=2320717 RepID=A0ABR2LJY2_9ASPA
MSFTYQRVPCIIKGECKLNSVTLTSFINLILCGELKPAWRNHWFFFAKASTFNSNSSTGRILQRVFPHVCVQRSILSWAIIYESRRRQSVLEPHANRLLPLPLPIPWKTLDLYSLSPRDPSSGQRTTWKIRRTPARGDLQPHGTRFPSLVWAIFSLSPGKTHFLLQLILSLSSTYGFVLHEPAYWIVLKLTKTPCSDPYTLLFPMVVD